MNSREDQLTMVNDCMARESRLNDWERNFVDGMANKLYNGGGLTETEDEKLEEVWDAATIDG